MTMQLQRQELISYLCKRYEINAALASETLSQLKARTMLDLIKECDSMEAAGAGVTTEGR
mgnify:FL=1